MARTARGGTALAALAASVGVLAALAGARGARPAGVAPGALGTDWAPCPGFEGEVTIDSVDVTPTPVEMGKTLSLDVTGQSGERPAPPSLSLLPSPPPMFPPPGTLAAPPARPARGAPPPRPPLPGADGRPGRAAAVPATVTEGGLAIDVTYAGIPIYHEDYRLCKWIQCPLESGPVKFSVSEPMPAVGAPGTYSVQLTGTDAGGANLFCFSTSFNVVFAESRLQRAGAAVKRALGRLPGGSYYLKRMLF